MKRAVSLLRQTLLMMVGLPDYDAYVRHRAERHPGEPVMTRVEYFRERQQARYGSGGGRCC